MIDPEKATEDELENCVDDAVVGRYARDMPVILIFWIKRNNSICSNKIFSFDLSQI